jgi:hypothetical protein
MGVVAKDILLFWVKLGRFDQCYWEII